LITHPIEQRAHWWKPSGPLCEQAQPLFDKRMNPVPIVESLSKMRRNYANTTFAFELVLILRV